MQQACAVQGKVQGHDHHSHRGCASSWSGRVVHVHVCVRTGDSQPPGLHDYDVSSADCQQSNSFQMDEVPRCARWMHTQTPESGAEGRQGHGEPGTFASVAAAAANFHHGHPSLPLPPSRDLGVVGLCRLSLCPRVCSWVGVAVVTVVPRLGLGLGLGLAWASYLGSLQIRWCPRNISVDRHARTSEGTVHRLSGCPGVLSRYSRGHGENGWACGHSDHE